MKTTNMLLTRGSVMIVALSIFAGCGPLSKSKKEEKSAPVASTQSASSESGAALCSINGKPVIHEADFMKSIAQVLQANPFWRGAGGADALPLAIKRKFLDEMVKQELIIADAQKHDVEADPAFQKELEEMLKLVKRSLIVQFFEKKIFDGIEVTDSDVKKHYNENKDRYVKVAGGVLVCSVAFDNDAAAEAFKAKAPTDMQAFEKLAKQETAGSFNDYGRVSKDARGEAGVEIAPKALKSAALGLSDFPAVGKAKVGKQFHVFCAADPKETEFFGLDEIRTQVEGILKNNLFRDKLDDRLKSLSGSFEVTINEDYFNEKGKEAPQDEADQGAPSVEEMSLESEMDAAAAA
jgi:hypothetical protein